MTLNTSQRRVLLAGAGLVLAAVVFPPFHVVGERGLVWVHYIGFLFGYLPTEGIHFRLSVNVPLLAVEIVAVAIATALAVLATRD